MTGIIKTDQLQGAQSTTVTVPTGNTLAVTSNATVGGTLGVTGTLTTAAITSTGRHDVNFNGSGTQAFKYTDTGGGNLASFGQFYNTSDALIGNVQNANNDGIHLNIKNGSIVFSNVGYTAANALDDYEEGEWTPTYVPANGSFGGSYLTQRGRYTKVGRKVTVELQLVANFSNNTQSGNVQIGGLPFTASAHSGGGAYGSLTIAQSTRFTGAAPKAGQIASGGTSIYVWTNLGVTGAGSDQTQLTTSNFILSGGNPNNIVASMTYLAS